MSEYAELKARLLYLSRVARDYDQEDMIAADYAEMPVTIKKAANAIEQLVATNETLTKERERLALAICGGEDAPGYANAQPVETLEKVARDWGVGMMEQINRTLALEAKLAQAEAGMRDIAAECGCSIARATLATIKGDTP